MKTALFFLGLLTTVLTLAAGQSGDMKPTAQFTRYGLQVVSSSPLSGVADAEIVLTSPQNLQLAYGLVNKTAGETSTSSYFIIQPSGGGRWTLAVSFAGSANYDLQLFGKTRSDQPFVQLASWPVRALVPLDFVTYSRFDRYGLKVLSASALKGAANVDIVLASERDLTLAYALLNKTAGDKSPKSFMMINRSKNGEYSIEIPFMDTADYELQLFGSAKGEKEDYSRPLARWNLSSAATQDAVIYPRFNRYGLQVVSASPLKDVADVEIAVSSSQDLELASGIRNVTAGEKSVKSLSFLSRSKDAQWILQTTFPQSGDYQLSIWGKPKNQDSFVTLATWNVKAQVSDKAVVYSRFGRYGLEVVSPPTDGVAEAKFVFASSQDLDLYYNLKNKADPKSSNSYLMFYPVDGRWSIPLFFTDSGEYELSLRGKVKSEDSFSLSDLGRWTIRAVVPAEPVIRYSSFDEDALKVVSATTMEDTAEAEILLASPNDLALRTSLYDLTTKSEVKGTAVAKKDGKYRIVAMFPKTGDYDLQLWESRTTKRSDGTSIMTPYLVARWKFHALVDSTVRPYLFGFNNSIRTIPFTSEEPVTNTEESPSGDDGTMGTLAENLDLSVFAGSSLSIKKGSQIEFWKKDRMIGRLTYVLPSALKLKSKNILLDCPKGTKLTFASSYWSEVDVDFSQDTSLTVGKQALRCTGSVHLFLDEGDFDLTLAKDTPMTIGKVRWVIPAKSQLNFTGASPQISTINLTQEWTVMVKGETKKVPSGWTVQFDDKGAVTDVFEGGY